MAKKKKALIDPDEDYVPDGKVDEDGDELIDLYEDKDDLADDVIYEIPDDDEMVAEETEEEEFGMEIDEQLQLLRIVKCKSCPGGKEFPDCKIRKDFGCPPDKEWIKPPKTEAERRR